MSLPPQVAEVALDYDSTQQAIVERAVTILGGTLERGITAEAWRDAVADSGEELLNLQVASAGMADDYLTSILEAQGADTAAVAAVNPDAWMDLTDGGGSWLRYLIFAPISVQAKALTEGRSFVDAVALMQTVASSIVITGLRDTARSSAQAGMQARPSVKSYVRMLRPPSCARCAILAGKKSSKSRAFRRHRGCDCVNIPSAEYARDWSTDPKLYFSSLSTSDQERIFTASGAKAIRLGANPAQVVNAQSGVYVAQAYGQELLATLEGTTKRGIAGKRLGDEGFSKTTGLKSSRYAYARTPRLLPDEIFLQAERLGWDDAEVLRQLRRFAYVI
jgi:hypothetical protein